MEIMVAVSIMTIGIVGIYAIVPRVVSITAEQNNKFIASQLSREGIEIVRNIRDSNWLERVNWDNGLTDCSGGCEIDYDDLALVSFQGRYLKIDSNEFYNYQDGQDTKFKRKITITPDTDILNVKVEINWLGKGSPFEIEENLYNWR